MNSKYRSSIYPIFSIFLSLFIMVFGLIRAKYIGGIYFLLAVYLLFFITGFYKACLKILPPFIILTLIFSGCTYLINKNISSTLAMTNRILTIFVSVIPGMSIRLVDLIRSFNQLRIPRVFTLGMLIAFNFVPLLRKEISQIREAMKIRIAGNMMSIKIFYRALLIPLVMRVVNISDTLSLSVETRGFTLTGNKVSVYKPVKPLFKDFAVLFFTVIFALISMVIK